jgi:Transposase
VRLLRRFMPGTEPIDVLAIFGYFRRIRSSPVGEKNQEIAASKASGCRRWYGGTRRFVRAYYLKEAFQLVWDYQQPKRAGRHLEKWMRSAMRSRLEPFMNPSAIVHSGSALPRTSLQRSITAAPGYPYQSNANHTFGTGA